MKGSKKWYSKISNWLIILACILLIPVLLINIYIMFQSKINPDKVPSVLGIKPFIVLSGSMEEEIYKGDLIFTKNIEPSRLKANDVIAFRDSEGTVTTHRIIELVSENGKTFFITKGDNNNTQDQNLVSFEDVEGIYIGRFPGIGSIMNNLSEPTTIIILLLGITIIFGFGFVISNKKQREQERKEFLEYKMQKEEQERKKIENKQKKELMEAINKAVVLEQKEPVQPTPTKKVKETQKVASPKPIAKKNTTKISEEKTSINEPVAKRPVGRPKKNLTETSSQKSTSSTKEIPSKKTTTKSKTNTASKSKASTVPKNKQTTNETKTVPKKSTSSVKKNVPTKKSETKTSNTQVPVKRPVGRPRKVTIEDTKVKATRTKKTTK